MRLPPHPVRNTLLAACLLALGGFAFAQGRGGRGGPGGPGRGMPGGGVPGGMPNGFPGNRSGPPPPNSPSSQSSSTIRGGLQLGPPGRWWDDKHFAKDLKLRPGQQQRMDSIFEDNRGALVSRYQALQQEESRMETLTHASAPDEPALFAQIDRVALAKAELEKVSTHYLLAIRKEMDPKQISRLEDHR